MFDVIIIGGGAAGFYGALHMALKQPQLKIAILERGRNVLTKVRISGGGRCNVTNAEYLPKQLIEHYPRGSKELLGPFFTHSSRDTISFFETRGIRMKTEEDGRIFPITNTSETIVNFFVNQAKSCGIQVIKNMAVVDLIPPEEVACTEESLWQIVCKKRKFRSRYVLIATGSNIKIWHMLSRLGYHIVDPVPSLFSFNIKDKKISGLRGISTNARVTVLKKNLTRKEITVGLKSKKRTMSQLTSDGPVLITHWGLSGPAILKLSAWGARELFEYGYKFRIHVNWIPEYHSNSVVSLLNEIRTLEGKKTVFRTNAFDIPRKLWGNLVKASGIDPDLRWADMRNTHLENLALNLCSSQFEVDGKSTYKEEFVTAGGVDLKQVDFKTFGSRLHPQLFFAGEILNIDAVTGGFNFQSAWTSSYIAAQAIVSGSQQNAQ